MPQEMLFCGTASFKNVDKDGDLGGQTTPRKEKKKPAAGGRKANPYSSRGLDKFSLVLAELESRREKVLRRVDGGGAGGHVMIRFAQSETKGWVPIVVKLPTEEPAKAEPKKKCKCNKPAAASSTTPPPTQPSSPRAESTSTSPRGDDAVKQSVAAATAPTKKKAWAAVRWPWGKKAVRPSQYWPFMAVLLLLSLVVFGRMFAICCTSIWWYLVPILNGEDGQACATRRPAEKTGGRHLGKKASDKKIGDKVAWASPLPPSHGKKGSSGGDHELISPRRSHGRKSSSVGVDHEVISPRSHAHGKKG